MEQGQIQQKLLDAVRAQSGGNSHLAQKLSEVLGISEDSAYRRIRGEKELSFSETFLLCQYAGISPDTLLEQGEGQLLFTGNYLEENGFGFTSFLSEIRDTLAKINACETREIIYQNKDISIFYYLMFPDLLTFKYHVWMKQHFELSSFRKTPFSFDILDAEQQGLINEINQLFLQIPTREILNPDNVLTDLRQIDYYRHTGGFAQASDMDRIFQALRDLVDHLENQAQHCRKFLPGTDPAGTAQNLQVYVHDFHYGDNESIVLADEDIFTVFTHTSINFMRTNDRTMGLYSLDFMENIIRKSTLISGAGEKFRTRFFNLIRERIELFAQDRASSLLH